MKILWIPLLVLVWIGSLVSNSIAGTMDADFFVATNGSDSWSGHLAKPNRNLTDGPFATLVKARDAVRQLKTQAGKKEIVVRVRAGTYRLDETLVFSIEDSAVDEGHITYAAYGDERPVITADVPLKNWRKLANDLPTLPMVAKGKIWFTDLPSEIQQLFTLYESENRLSRARGPGFAPVSSADHKPATDRFKYPPNSIQDWPDLTEGELLIIPTADYEMCVLPLAEVDVDKQLVMTSAPASRPIGSVKFVPISAWVENMLEVLDQPGEWAVNLKERKVYYWPQAESPGENIVAPRLTELIRVEGKIDNEGLVDTPVRGLVFHGLTFSHAERYAWHGSTGWGLQHHWELFDRPTAAVRFRGAEECAVQNCRFVASSGSGLRLDLHCQKNMIAGNEFGHLGGHRRYARRLWTGNERCQSSERSPRQLVSSHG